MPGPVCPSCKAQHDEGATCAGFGPRQKRQAVVERPSPATAEPAAAVVEAASPVPAAAVSPEGSAGRDDAESLILEIHSARREPGVTLGPYRLLEMIGEGGMGCVYRAEDTALDRPVAVKVISRAMLRGASEEALARFLSEAKLTARIRHPNVVQVYSLGTDPDGNPYLVMELLAGRSLKDAQKAKETFPVPRVLHIATQVLSALAAAHEHLVHRDLKPANIFLTKGTDGEEVVKVLDFGVAKAMDDPSSELTGAGRFVGTPAYIAPEVVRGTGQRQDPRQDLYAVGVILFELLTGVVPWPSRESRAIFGALQAGKRPRAVREVLPGADPHLADAIDRALATDPEKRWQSALEFRAALRSLGELTPGSVWAETYRIERQLGAGGMSAVYLARDLRMERRCALKVLLVADEDDPGGTLRERFRQDGALAKEVRHPNVVEVYAQGVWRGRPYLVTELVEGQTLRERWGRFSWPDLLAVVKQVASALDATHAAGIVHRDVTPENILVDDRLAAKLVDFGLARRDGSELTGSQVGFPIGRHGYAPPEQMLDPREVTPSSDTWSLAAVVYEGLTGRVPYRDPSDASDSGGLERFLERLVDEPAPQSAKELNPSVTDAVAAVLLRGLAKDEAARYASAGVFADALGAAAAEGVLLRVAETSAPAAADEPSLEPVPAKQAAVARDPARGAPELSDAAKRVRTGRWPIALAAAAGVAAIAGAIAFGPWNQAAVPDRMAPHPMRAASPPDAPASLAQATTSPAAEPNSTAVASVLGTLRIDSRPSGATLRVGPDNLPLPASVTRPLGTRLAVVATLPGYEPLSTEVVFRSARDDVVLSLEPLPTRKQGKQAGQDAQQKSKGSDYEWKELYVRPGEHPAK
jgi:serine/threonine protein kinase